MYDLIYWYVFYYFVEGIRDFKKVICFKGFDKC